MFDYIPDDIIFEDDITSDSNKTYAVLLNRDESESGDLAVGLVRYTDSNTCQVLDEYDLFEQYSNMLADRKKTISPKDEWDGLYNWVSSHNAEVTFSKEILDYFEMAECDDSDTDSDSEEDFE